MVVWFVGFFSMNVFFSWTTKFRSFRWFELIRRNRFLSFHFTFLMSKNERIKVFDLHHKGSEKVGKKLVGSY